MKIAIYGANIKKKDNECWLEDVLEGFVHAGPRIVFSQGYLGIHVLLGGEGAPGRGGTATGCPPIRIIW